MDIRELVKSAGAHLKGGDATAALEVIQQVLIAEPNHLRASLIAAECLLALGTKDNALHVLSTAATAAPTSSTMSAVARLLEKRGGDASIRAAVIGHGTLEPLAAIQNHQLRKS